MKYLSVCSGIEAATAAWHPLKWVPVAFSEIDKFPSAVLAHHYPDIPNLGDMTRWEDWSKGILSAADILVGGTPCQAFSVAGLRNSLADDRGNLTLTYGKILNEIDKQRARLGRPPAICLWENVPGILSTKDNAFGSFLAALAGEHDALQPPGGKWKDAGYVRGPKRTIAWRILDAQHFGVPQRRRRLFLVASARDGFRPEKILFECEGVRRNPTPSREKGQKIAASLTGGFREPGVDADQIAICFDRQSSGEYGTAPIASTMAARDYKSVSDIVVINTAPLAVRRLTPRECERIQGFPDDYTAIPWVKKSATECPTGPRYKALGNSMAVPVMRWIGERIKNEIQ